MVIRQASRIIGGKRYYHTMKYSDTKRNAEKRAVRARNKGYYCAIVKIHDKHGVPAYALMSRIRRTASGRRVWKKK